MPNNTFPTSLEIVRDLFSHMETRFKLSETDSKHLDGSSKKLFSAHYDVELFLNQLCPKEFSDRTELQFITLLKRNVLDRYNAMLLHARLTSLMDIEVIRNALWSNYLVPALYQLVEFCVTQMGVTKHWRGENFIQESLKHLKNHDQKFAEHLKSEFLSPDDKNYISKFGRKDALPTPSTLKRLFPIHNEVAQSNFELLCFARFMQALKIEYGLSLKHGNFIQFLAEQHNQKVKSHNISQHDIQALTFRAMAVANLQTHYSFLIEIPFSYQNLTSTFFEKSHLKRIDRADPHLAALVFSPTCKTNHELNILMLDQINKYLNEHKEVHHLLPYIHWAKAINLVYQYQFQAALAEYELCLKGLLYRDMRYLEILLSEMLCIASLIPSQNKLIAKISNLAIQFDIKVGIFDDLERPDRFKTEFVYEDWEKEANLVEFFKFFTDDTFSDKGTEINKLIPKMGSIAIDVNIVPDYKKVNKTIFVDLEQRRKWPQLHYFVTRAEFDIAKQLIQAGADVNKLTSTNDSVVLLALNHAAFLEKETIDFINFVFKNNFDKELLNVRTAKKQTSPLNSAVGENLPKIVKLLLEHGANPNITSLNGVSVLYQCIGLIGQLNGHTSEIVPDKYMADSIKRYTNGEGDLQRYMQIQQLPANNPKKRLFEEIKELSISDKKIEDTYEIFELLLQYGANPNQDTAQHPIKGYTPFMLAIEKDNLYAVDLMLKHGALLNQSYVKADEGRRIFLNEIADYFNANNVKRLLS